MTNTIHNVPRELLENTLNKMSIVWQSTDEMDQLRALLSAPSPAGVDGLEVVAWQHWGDRTKLLCALGKERGIPGSYTDEFTRPLCRLSDAQAIIDGLRGEVERSKSFAAGHVLTNERISAKLHTAETERDQQAQRIGELEWLLDRVKVSLSLDDTEWGYSAPEKYKLLADIRAALSAGKEGE